MARCPKSSCDRIFDAELEFRDDPRQPSRFRCQQADRHVPLVAGAGAIIVGDRRTGADLPGIRQVVEQEVQEMEVTGVGDVAPTAARSDSEEVLGKES